MAISSYKVFLMKASGSGEEKTWAKLLDIKSFPDLGGAPDLLETTTLSDKMQTFIEGIQSLDAFEFTANYTLEDYQGVTAQRGVEAEYAVWFGGTESGNTLTPTGEYGKFSWTGTISAYPVGAGVNEVVDMNITITPSTVIQFSIE